MKTLRDLDYSVLQQCMHCGLCLPTCPTYEETKRERHSPRGRIALMRAIADGELEVTKTFGEEMYYCLGCLACTSACPAGVNYAELLETARADVEQAGVLATPTRSFIRTVTLRVVFTRPRLLRAIGRLLWLWQASGLQTLARRAGLMNLLPSNLRRLEPQAPTILAKFSHQLIQPIESPVAPRAALDVGRSMLDVERCPAPSSSAVRLRRVVVLTGCVQDLAFADINRATVDVLLANGCEVHTPPVQPCCGSLHAHNGDNATARDLARGQIDLINPADFDAIISNAGGCGSHLRAYGHLLHDDPAYAQKAATWSAKLRDIHEYLVAIDFRPPAAPSVPVVPAIPVVSVRATHPAAPCANQTESESTAPTTTVTYHESCHLCHGQKVSAQPRAILRALPGVVLSECAESQWCCGSAGIYNITQPETAARLQERKVGHVLATGAHIVATANPGCHLQLTNGLAQHVGTPGDPAIVVTHPVVLLARAYAAEKLG